ncbi:MAG: hypothetical protein GWN86_10705 [Desulfobacterales bacterium]|nr:hypothetical protein [Desulfobacterales bacterium]
MIEIGEHRTKSAIYALVPKDKKDEAIKMGYRKTPKSPVNYGGALCELMLRPR